MGNEDRQDQDRPPTNATVEEYLAWQMRRKVELIAEGLHGLADRIAQARPGNVKVSYAYVAERVTTTVLNALPTLGLGQLAEMASQADVARAKGE